MMFFRYALAIFMIFAGAMHFLNPQFYLAMMPPYLPFHELLVELSGIFEILLGIGLLVPKLVVIASYGCIALFVAVFPANLHMAVNPHMFSDIQPALLYLRLPLQLLFIYWAWRVGKQARQSA
jgi:uncharacterized membrane protein